MDLEHFDNYNGHIREKKGKVTMGNFQEIIKVSEGALAWTYLPFFGKQDWKGVEALAPGAGAYHGIGR